MLKTTSTAASASVAPGIENHVLRKLKTPELRRVADKIGYFSAADILRSFKGKEREELERIATLKTYRRGEALYVPGKTGEVSYILKEGKVRVSLRASDGSKIVITMLGPNAFFGEMPLLGQGMYGAGAEAIEDSVVWVLGRQDVERLLMARPKIGLRLLRLVSHRLRDVEMQLEEMMFKTIRARIAILLLRYLSPGGRIVKGFSHQEIADRLGVYRETVTHTLNELKRMGLIEIGRKKLKVLDPDRLRQIAQK